MNLLLRLSFAFVLWLGNFSLFSGFSSAQLKVQTLSHIAIVVLIVVAIRAPSEHARP